MLELARLKGGKGTGSSSSITEPIAAPLLSVAPAEGPEPGRKRRKLVKALPSSAAAAAPAPSTEELWLSSRTPQEETSSGWGGFISSAWGD